MADKDIDNILDGALRVPYTHSLLLIHIADALKDFDELDKRQPASTPTGNMPPSAATSSWPRPNCTKKNYYLVPFSYQDTLKQWVLRLRRLVKMTPTRLPKSLLKI